MAADEQNTILNRKRKIEHIKSWQILTVPFGVVLPKNNNQSKLK